MRSLARRHQALGEDITDLEQGMHARATAALHHIVKVSLWHDPISRAYRETHLAKGWTKAAVLRALKRAVAQQVFQAFTGHCVVPDYSDLRPARRAKNLTLTAATRHLGYGRRGSENSDSANDPKTTSPTATAKGSTPLDTQ